MFKGLIAIVYLVVGAVVASSKNYFDHLGNIKGIASAILAVVLWPLVLLDVDLHLGDSGKKGGGKKGGGNRKEQVLIPLMIWWRMLFGKRRRPISA